jgi:hypothetical protein
MKIDGACHCGKLAYQAEIDPDRVGVCHCTDCQVLSGSAFSVFVPAPAASFSLRGGEPKTYIKTAESGAKRLQAFCPDCGTRIYATDVSDQRTFNIRVGTIRQRADLLPRRQIWCRSAYAWVMELGSVERMAKQ